MTTTTPEEHTMTQPTFDGITYDPALDRERLAPQLRAVFDVLWAYERVTTAGGQWLTLAELSRLVEFDIDRKVPEASISARLRDLRKPRNGGWQIERRRRGETGGTWEYRLGQRGFYVEQEEADPMSHVTGGITYGRLGTAHRSLQRCPECTQDLSTSGLTRLAYTFEVCRCGALEGGHLVQQMWHRTCLASHDSYLIAHPTEERFQ